jgi:metal-responsive CopG/Arc/MetJ family transcriptional regulator
MEVGGLSLILWYYLGYTREMKTAVSIPGPLFQAADRLARRLGIARSRLYSRAIERYVAEAQERDVTTLLNQIYADETAELDPALAALQAASLQREPW